MAVQICDTAVDYLGHLPAACVQAIHSFLVRQIHSKRTIDRMTGMQILVRLSKSEAASLPLLIKHSAASLKSLPRLRGPLLYPLVEFVASMGQDFNWAVTLEAFELFLIQNPHAAISERTHVTLHMVRLSQKFLTDRKQ